MKGMKVVAFDTNILGFIGMEKNVVNCSLDQANDWTKFLIIFGVVTMRFDN